MPPLSLTAGDCAICFGRVRRRWAQPTDCDCRPIIHEECWLQWAEKRGPTCIICRGPQPEPFPHRADPILVILPYDYDIRVWLLLAISLAYITLVLMGPGRKIMRQFYEL
jgi:hypothetical protein